jgi:E3 ubiquitin-protein ligase UBR4
LPSVVVKSDDQQWKEFVTKPSLRFILRALTGLSVKHSPTQLAVSDSCVPILHQIEQVTVQRTLFLHCRRLLKETHFV